MPIIFLKKATKMKKKKKQGGEMSRRRGKAAGSVNDLLCLWGDTCLVKLSKKKNKNSKKFKKKNKKIKKKTKNNKKKNKHKKNKHKKKKNTNHGFANIFNNSFLKKVQYFNIFKKYV